MSEPVLDIRRPSPHVAEVWLNRPDVRNAFNDGVIAALTNAFARLNQDADLRVVLLAGHGKAFCAGADLNWMRAMADYSWEENRADAQKLADMLWTLDQCPVPVVGRVHGDCYAGGMGLASVCDVLVASDNVTFCLSEARLGLLPATIGPYVVRAMGEQASRRYFTTQRSVSVPHRPRPWALCTSCVHPGGTGCARGKRRFGPGGQRPCRAVRACKRLVRDVAARPLDDVLRAETARRIADIRASDEGREGVQSFLNKRKPNWLVA
jgi:methylglutaconyl-CoA hydratase